MSKSPNVLFKLEYNSYHSPGSPETKLTLRRDFVSGNGTTNLFDYLTRKAAVEKDDIEIIKAVEQLAQHTDLKEEDLLDYTSNRPGSTGAFNANGDIYSEKATEIRKKLRTTKSTIWTGILSFKGEYGKNYCDTKAEAHKLMKAEFDNLFKNSPLKYENIEWYAALHANTSNRHIHVVFWENEATFLRKGSTEYNFSNQQKFSQQACDNFKFSVASHFEAEPLLSFQIRDDIRQIFRRKMNTGIKKDALFELLNDVKECNSWSFGKQNSTTKEKILHFAMDIIDNNVELKNKYDNYLDAIMKQQQKYLDICKANKLTPSKNVKDFTNKNTKDLHNRIGNDVIFSLKKFDKDYQAQVRKKSGITTQQYNMTLLFQKDIDLIKNIETKPTGSIFIKLFNGIYSTQENLEGIKYYRTEEAAALAFSSILCFFTQDKEQFDRIIQSSSIYTPDLLANYDKQIDWAKNVGKINTEKKLYQEVLFDLALWQYNQKTALNNYNNKNDIDNLLDADYKIIDKIKASKWNDKYTTIMNSEWNNTQSDTKGELKGYHLHCFHFVNLCSRFTQNSEQIDRIFKASPLYNPEKWNGNYKGEFSWIPDFSTKDNIYSDVLKNYCIDRQIEWKILNPLKKTQLTQGKQVKQGNLLIYRATIAGRTLTGLVNNAFSLINTRIDNSFNQFQSALKDQERKRKQLEGDILVNE